MATSKPVIPLDQQALRMVCSISSGMLGICLTAISLLRVAISISHRTTLVDDLLSLNALLFLATTISSYLALRTMTARRLVRLERFSDRAFMASMAFLTINCFLVTHAISNG